MSVHPTAQVDPNAKIDPQADIKQFCLIHPNVEIGAGCVIGPYAEIKNARIGEGTKIGSHSIIGGDPQMQKWDDIPSIVRIGKNNDIREMVTIHRSREENGETVIGDRNMIMTNTHIGHDCLIGNETVITTYAGLSGHVTVEDFAMIGGQVGVHQFVRIGESSMIAGMTRIVQDVTPFMLAEGNPSAIRGINAVGLKRRGFRGEVRSNIKEACKILFRSGLNLKSAKEKIGKMSDAQGEIEKILNFLNSTTRGITGL